MLEVEGLSVSYGKHRALAGASLTVKKSEIVVILGANGAGKTTLLKALCGISEGQVDGTVEVDGFDLTGAAPDRIVEAGVALVPEGRGIFADLSVQENLALGAYAARARDEASGNLERVLTLFPKLSERRKQVVRTMSGGEQQMVAIGRAMMSNPQVLALDEPSLGLSPLLCKELFQSLRTVRESGLGVLLVEQNAKQSLAIADRGYLLENGEIVHEDSAKALASDPSVQKAYLGGGGGKPARAPAPSAPVAPRKPRPAAGPSPSDIATAALQGVTPVPRPSVTPAPPAKVAASARPATPASALPAGRPTADPLPAPSGEIDIAALVSRAAQASSRKPGGVARSQSAAPPSLSGPAVDRNQLNGAPAGTEPRLPGVGARAPVGPGLAGAHGRPPNGGRNSDRVPLTPRPLLDRPDPPSAMPNLSSSSDRLRSALDEIETAARRAEAYRPTTRPRT